MRYARFLLLAVIFCICASSAIAQETTCIYFFYGDGCQHCAKAEPHLTYLESKHDLDIQKFEIYKDRQNMLLLSDYFDSYDIPDKDKGVPVIFIADKYLIGYDPIVEQLDELIKSNKGAECPVLNGVDGTGVVGKKSPLERLAGLSLLTIIGAAFVDSINPCAIAVLLILMAALMAAGRKGRAIKAGLAFTLSIYIAYFLFGIGLFSAIQVSGFSYWIYKGIGILAVLIGLANIKDFFWYGAGGFVMEIPRSWRPTLKNLLSKVTSPLGAFLIGFIVCFFELPCTGGPYIVILGLLADRMTLMASIPLLILYNVVFVLPLIFITLLVYAGYSTVEKTTEWKERNLRLLHLIAGLIMLALGALIVFGFV